AGDVLHHDDGIVDEDADREDQGEQADAVDGVAHQVGGKQRQQDGGGDDDQRDCGLPPADGDRDQGDDGDGRKAQVEQQLVGLLVGRLAVVAGDGDGDVGGNQPALARIEPVPEVLGPHDRVGAGPLRGGAAHGRHPVPVALVVPRVVPDTVLPRTGPNDHGGNVVDVDRPAVAGGDQQEPDVGYAGQRLPGRDAAGNACLAYLTRQEGAVGVAHLGDQLLQGDAVEGELLRRRLDADLLWTAAGNVGETDVVRLHELGAQLVGELVEILVRPSAGGFRRRRQSQDDDGYVVDAPADDQRLGNADGDAVHVGADLFVHAQDRVLCLGAHQEPRRHHDAVVLAPAVDMLHAVDGLDDGLERLGHQLDGVGRLEAVGVDADVDHGDADLRLLLARNDEEGDEAQRDGRQQEEGCERRANGRARQPS